jgi:quercetin dioxygenase-like cupin family protein
MDIDAISKNPNYKQIDPEYVQFDEVDDIWIRSYTIKKVNNVLAQHVHEHDHATIVSRGTIEAWQDGEILGQFTGPAVVKIPAGKKHFFKALTDDVVLCCLHNLRGTDLESPKIKE